MKRRGLVQTKKSARYELYDILLQLHVSREVARLRYLFEF